MHTAQHLPKRKIERAQTRLSGRRFIAAAIVVTRVMQVMRVTFVLRFMRAGITTTRMPCSVYERVLLRYEQQYYTEIMVEPARHVYPCLARTNHSRNYLPTVPTVNTASVSR